MAKKGARTSKKSKRKGVRSRLMLSALLVLCLLAGGFMLWMHACAKITHVENTHVYLEDLPDAFDGATLLFISDIDIRTEGDLRACRKLMRQLGQLHPDMLMLGGDYSADTLMDVLNDRKNPESAALAREFISSLAEFEAPLGKYAVGGENDVSDAGLAAAFEGAGVQYLSDRCEVAERGGEELVIAGLSEVTLKQTKYSSLGSVFSGDECVIVLAHNPAAYVGVRVAEARGGGAWADLVLTGHNLGGQINVFGRPVRSMTDEEKRTVAGWFYPDDLPLLVSQGLGCKGPMLRLDSRSEIHLITLKKQRVQTPKQEIYLPVLS